MKQRLIRALIRAVRVFVAGAIGSAAMVPFNGQELKPYLFTLIGVGIAGGLLGLDKFIRDSYAK
jgi:hypothetical protein